MSTIPVRGQLQHRFHGNENVAAVALYVDTPAAEQQLEAALRPLGLRFKLASEKTSRYGAAIGPLTSEQLDVLKAWLEPLRTDPPCTLFDCAPRYRRFGRTYGRHDIDSMAHSIDYGPQFELELPYVDLVTAPLPFPE